MILSNYNSNLYYVYTWIIIYDKECQIYLITFYLQKIVLIILLRHEIYKDIYKYINRLNGNILLFLIIFDHSLIFSIIIISLI